VARSSTAALKAFYARFRATAEHEAEDLVPALADALARHLLVSSRVASRRGIT
jgi:hypothetical protein